MYVYLWKNLDFNAMLLPVILLLCKLQVQYFTERQNLCASFWLHFTNITYKMTVSITFSSFIRFLYILLVHWACGKILLQWVLLESFEFAFLSLGLLYLLMTWIYLLVTYLSQLVPKRQPVFFFLISSPVIAGLKDNPNQLFWQSIQKIRPSKSCNDLWLHFES